MQNISFITYIFSFLVLKLNFPTSKFEAHVLDDFTN